MTAALVIGFVVLLLVIDYVRYRPRRITGARIRPDLFRRYYREKRDVSAALGVRPGCDERFTGDPGKRYAAVVLYIHGFRSSRAEGEYVMDQVSEKLALPVYYLRLPGHGTSPEDQTGVTFNDCIDEAEEALFMMDKIAHEVYLCGTSMGGAIAFWLAGQYGHRIGGVILVSPFYQFASPVIRMMNSPLLFNVYRHFRPMVIDKGADPEEEDNWTCYWYRNYYFTSLKILTDLRRLMRLKRLEKNIHIPVLMFYFENNREQDRSASVNAMKQLFGNISRGENASSRNRLVRVTHGGHVLMSRYFPSDYETMTGEISAWLSDLRRLS